MIVRYMPFAYGGELAPWWGVNAMRAGRLPRNVASPCTEAEANIIAFALNQIADGLQLAAGSDYSFATQGYETYAGPTEGVAP
jgi:hypothetical protein